MGSQINKFVQDNKSDEILFKMSNSEFCYRFLMIGEDTLRVIHHTENVPFKSFLYNEVKYDGVSDISSINKYMDDFEEIIKILKLSVKGRDVNYNISKLCRVILDEKAFKDKEFEDLDEFETEKIEKITAGQYITYVNVDKETTEETTTYDVNSFYAYVLKSSTFSYNFKRGKKRLITDEDAMPSLYENQYFYIDILDSSTLPFYIKTDKKSLWITNWDLLIYQQQGTKYKLNQSLTYNNYYYEKCDTSRNHYFEKNIDKIYKLKSSNTLIKRLLSLIIGVMFTKNIKKVKTFYKLLKNNDSKIKGYTFSHQNADDDGNDMFIYTAENNLCEQHNITRNKLFLFAYIKYKFLYLIKPVVENKISFYKIYCDSITCDKNKYLDDLLSDKCGGFKIEDKDYNNKVGKFTNCKGGFKLKNL